MTQENALAEVIVHQLGCSNCHYGVSHCHKCRHKFQEGDDVMCKDVDIDYRQENGPGKHYCVKCNP